MMNLMSLSVAKRWKKSKPAPDIFLEASRRLGISPMECAVIEDSTHGINSAKTAGMFCYGYNADGQSKQAYTQANIEATHINQVIIDVQID